MRCRLAPVPGEHGEVLGLIGTVADHTDAERQLEHRATHDELTELPNRVLLAAHLDAALGRASFHRTAGRRAVRRPPARRRGHRRPRPRHRRPPRAPGRPPRGRRRRAPTRSSAASPRTASWSCSRASPTPPRPPTSPPGSSSPWRVPFVIDDDEAFIGAAVGIAIADGDVEGETRTVDQLVSDAGVAMARAVEAEAGVEVFDVEMRSQVEERRTLELSLRRGLERGRVRPRLPAHRRARRRPPPRLRGAGPLGRPAHPRHGPGPVHPGRRGLRPHRRPRRRAARPGLRAAGPLAAHPPRRLRVGEHLRPPAGRARPARAGRPGARPTRAPTPPACTSRSPRRCCSTTSTPRWSRSRS